MKSAITKKHVSLFKKFTVASVMTLVVVGCAVDEQYVISGDSSYRKNTDAAPEVISNNVAELICSNEDTTEEIASNSEVLLDNSTAQLDNTLGGTTGFGSKHLPNRADDPTDSVGIDLTSIWGSQGINLGGGNFTKMYVNLNGVITFGTAHSSFTPSGIQNGINMPAIAIYWRDLDTRNTSVNTSTGGTSTGTNDIYSYADNSSVIITWDDVANFSNGNTSVLAGQIKLARLDGGNTMIELRYEHAHHKIDSTTVAGWNVGRTGQDLVSGQDFYEIPANTNPVSESNIGKPGIWRFLIGESGEISNECEETAL